MRIALLAREVSPSYAGGGIATYTHALAAGLRELGAEVVVVGRHPGPPLFREGVAYAPEVHLPHRFAPMLVDRAEAAWEGRRALRRFGPFDVVEGPDWLAEGLLSPRGPLRARHVHGSNRLLRQWEGRGRSRGERAVDAVEHLDLLSADVVTVTSRLSTTLPDGRVLFPTAVLVPMPVVLGEPPRASAGAAPRVVTLLGRVEPRKGGDVLIRAAARLRHVTVRLVGRDMPYPGGASYLAVLHGLANELGVALEVVGGTDAGGVATALESSRVVAVPSRYEPFSIAALESYAARRPVILSDTTGASEVLPAPVFASGDVAALAEALKPLLDDPDHASAQGDQGRLFVEQHHNPRRAAIAKLAAWGYTSSASL